MDDEEAKKEPAEKKWYLTHEIRLGKEVEYGAFLMERFDWPIRNDSLISQQRKHIEAAPGRDQPQLQKNLDSHRELGLVCKANDCYYIISLQKKLVKKISSTKTNKPPRKVKICEHDEEPCKCKTTVITAIPTYDQLNIRLQKDDGSTVMIEKTRGNSLKNFQLIKLPERENGKILTYRSYALTESFDPEVTLN